MQKIRMGSLDQIKLPSRPMFSGGLVLVASERKARSFAGVGCCALPKEFLL